MAGSIEKRSRFWTRNMWRALVLWYLLPLAAGQDASFLVAQQPQTPAFRVEASLVEVPVTVTDKKGRAKTGLAAQDFRIYEDGVEQTLHHFTSEPGPVSWGLILDKSGSMATMMEDVYAAAVHMVEASTPGSEAFIMVFSDTAEIVQEFTTNRVQLRKAVGNLISGGSTALWDAVSLGLDEMKNAKYDRKALLVVTDGDDNRSMTTSRELIQQVKESDVLVYSVAMTDVAEHGLPFWLFGSATPNALIDLARASGASAHRPRSVGQCRKAITRIASEVNHQYILGYYSRDTSGPPRFRKLTVRVEPPKGTGRPVVRARSGYFGPHKENW